MRHSLSVFTTKFLSHGVNGNSLNRQNERLSILSRSLPAVMSETAYTPRLKKESPYFSPRENSKLELHFRN